MRKLLVLLVFLLVSASSVFAAKIPDDVKDYLKNNIKGVDIRFDGVIIYPDNTIYLPLYPSLFSDITELKIKETFPANKEIGQNPDIIIFNNDFVMLKVLNDGAGRKTVLHQTNPPLQVRTGLLPQDMLVPSGLIIPENIKGIIGNLKIDTKQEDVIKVNVKESFEEFLDNTSNVKSQTLVPQLKGKTLFVTTNYSKNIQVVEPPNTSSSYALAQKSIPVDIKVVKDGKFLLVTSYERPFLDIISVADSRYIKQLSLSAFPEEILIDEDNNKAYITAPSASMLFVVDLNTMSLIQKIKLNGYCEKLLLAENKLFYVDKLKNEIWAIDMENEYQLIDVGSFPNVSALAFKNDNLFISSRTKSRVAVVDFTTLGLAYEFTTVNKPIDMKIYGENLYVLGAEGSKLQVIRLSDCKEAGKIDLGLNGFSNNMNIFGNIAIITDIKKNLFSLVDLDKGVLIKTYVLNIPMKDVVVANKVDLFD